MPVSVGQLRANTRTIVVPYFDDEVRLTYKPSEMTPAVESTVSEAARDGDNGPMLDLLGRMIVEWDVEDADGEQYPRSAESLNNLPSPFLTALLDAMREDMAPKARRERSSFAR